MNNVCNRLIRENDIGRSWYPRARSVNLFTVRMQLHQVPSNTNQPRFRVNREYMSYRAFSMRPQVPINEHTRSFQCLETRGGCVKYSQQGRFHNYLHNCVFFLFFFSFFIPSGSRIIDACFSMEKGRYNRKIKFSGQLYALATV